MLLSFSGLDGAGKSTQIDLLKQFLSQNGTQVEIIWARGGYTPGFEWLKRTLRKILREKLPEPGASEYRQNKLSQPFIARIWLNIAIFDLIYIWGVYFRFQLLLHRVVICDRYLNDSRLDFLLNFPHVEFEKMFLWKLLCFVAPKPDAAFLLWIPVEESMKRSILKDEPFPNTEKTLKWRLSIYMDNHQFSERDYLKLDCQRSVDSIHSEILQYIQRKIDRGSLR